MARNFGSYYSLRVPNGVPWGTKRCFRLPIISLPFDYQTKLSFLWFRTITLVKLLFGRGNYINLVVLLVTTNLDKDQANIIIKLGKSTRIAFSVVR